MSSVGDCSPIPPVLLNLKTFFLNLKYFKINGSNLPFLAAAVETHYEGRIGGLGVPSDFHSHSGHSVYQLVFPHKYGVPDSWFEGLDEGAVNEELRLDRPEDCRVFVSMD